MKSTLLAFCLSLAAVLIQGASKIAYEDRFTDYGVYIITSRAFVGVLTFNKTNESSEVPPITAESNVVDNSGQKWRIDKSTLHRAYQIRPTKDEEFVLAFENRQGVLQWILSGGWGQEKLWYLQDAGDGFTQIKNKHSGVCLQSNGIDKSVTAADCNNEIFQQWKLSSNLGTI